MSKVGKDAGPEEVMRLLRNFEGEYQYPSGLMARAAEVIEELVREQERTRARLIKLNQSMDEVLAITRKGTLKT